MTGNREAGAAGLSNAQRTGWEGFFDARGRDECPFPKARRDLLLDYQSGWDQAFAHAAGVTGNAPTDAVGMKPEGRNEPNNPEAGASDLRERVLHLAVDMAEAVRTGSEPNVEAAAEKATDAILALIPTAPSPTGEEPVAWRCFHCDETFTDERCARLHFGGTEDHDPACQIKGAEGGLLEALRRAESDLTSVWQTIHEESTEAAKAYYAQQTRHREQLRAVEQAGYDKGIADVKANPESVGLAHPPQAVETDKLRAMAIARSGLWAGIRTLEGLGVTEGGRVSIMKAALAELDAALATKTGE